MRSFFFADVSIFVSIVDCITVSKSFLALPSNYIPLPLCSISLATSPVQPVW